VRQSQSEVASRRSGRALVALLALAVSLGSAGAALADGDPASDTLLYADVFVPYSQSISDPVTKDLQRALADAKQHGQPIKVAVISGIYDLGSVGGLMGKPQQYARFLGEEDGFGQRDKSLLLVVMPQGFGVYAGPAKPVTQYTRRLRGLKAGTSAEALAKSATAAVGRITGESVSTHSSESPWRQRIVIALAAVVALAFMVALSMLAPRARRKRRAETQRT
jgi:hypothetical protein